MIEVSRGQNTLVVRVAASAGEDASASRLESAFRRPLRQVTGASCGVDANDKMVIEVSPSPRVGWH